MKANSRGFTMIVILVALLIVAYLTMRSWQEHKTVDHLKEAMESGGIKLQENATPSEYVDAVKKNLEETNAKAEKALNNRVGN